MNNGNIPQDLEASPQGPQPGVPFNFSKVLDTVLIPQVIYSDARLSPGARLLWGIIRRLAHKSGQCFATEARLADEMAVSLRQVQRYCRQLVEAKLLRETEAPGRAKVRELLWHQRFNSGGTVSAMSYTLQENNRRRLTDGNRPPPLTDPSPPTPDGSVRGGLTDPSGPNLIDFLRGPLEADSPPPSRRPPLDPPPQSTGGEEEAKVKSQGESIDCATRLDSQGGSPAGSGPLSSGEERIPLSGELHAGDRSPESLAKFLRHSYWVAMDAEPPLIELNAIVRLLRANKADHIAYSLAMQKLAKTSKRKIGIGMWIKVAAAFGQQVTAEQLRRR